MRIAVFTGTGAFHGGSRQYALGVIEAVKSQFSKDSYKIFSLNKSWCKNSESQLENIVELPQEKNEFLMKMCRQFANQTGARFIHGKYRPIYDYQPDLVVCTNPTSVGSFLRLPYVTPIHDLQHRVYRHLPEISTIEALKRERNYRIITKTSLINVVNCYAVKQQVQKFYKVSTDAIEIVHEVPSPYFYKNKNMTKETAIRGLAKYNLPDQFLFYPAQLWSHKNHLQLLKALTLLYNKERLKIPVVFVGSKKEKSTYQQINSFLKQSPIREFVKFLGYIDDLEMVSLFKRSRALVFPSINISTGIPVSEALFMGLPVLCSNLDCYKAQAGKAGLFFDPFNAEDIADKIRSFWLKPEIENALCVAAEEKGERMAKENFSEEWTAVIMKAIQKIGNGYNV